jgi:hypothetical protein
LTIHHKNQKKHGDMKSGNYVPGKTADIGDRHVVASDEIKSRTIIPANEFNEDLLSHALLHAIERSSYSGDREVEAARKVMDKSLREGKTPGEDYFSSAEFLYELLSGDDRNRIYSFYKTQKITRELSAAKAPRELSAILV